MKRFLLFALSILCAILGMNPAAVRAGTNVWTSIGPDGGRVQAIAVDPQNPDTVYAVAGGAIFKTTDGAANWKRVYAAALSGGAANDPAVLVAIRPQDSNTVYAGTANFGVLKSTDGGTSWSMANAGLPKPASILNGVVGATGFDVRVLTIDPRNPETIYAGMDGGLPPYTQAATLFKSTDGGTNWRTAGSVLPFPDYEGSNIGTLAIHPQDSNTLYAGADADGPPGGIFKSTDGGAGWSASGDGLPGTAIAALAIDPRNPDTLYAAPRRGFFKSTDGGASWSAASSGLPIEPILSLAIDPQNPDTLYASIRPCDILPCAYSGVFKSTDGGTSWTGSGLASSTQSVLAIDPINPDTVYAGTDNGIVKSLDAGTDWSAANSGLTASQIDFLAVDPQNAGSLLAISQGKVLRTAAGGAQWSEIYTPLPTDDGHATYPASTLVADRGAPGTYYVGIAGNGDGGGGILRSADGGASWHRMPLPARGGIQSLTMDPQNPGTLYASTNHALYKSTDGGASWSEIAGQKEEAAGAPSQCFGSVVVDPGNPGTLYVGTCRLGGGLFKSTDGGQTWSSLAVPSSYGFTNILAMDPQNSATVYVADVNSVLKTTDGGKNWRAFSSGLPATGNVQFVAVDPQYSNIVYAANQLGVFWSLNGGANWSPLNSGLANLDVQTLLIDPRNPDTIYAATYDGGVFAMTFSR